MNDNFCFPAMPVVVLLVSLCGVCHAQERSFVQHVQDAGVNDSIDATANKRIYKREVIKNETHAELWYQTSLREAAEDDLNYVKALLAFLAEELNGSASKEALAFSASRLELRDLWMERIEEDYKAQRDSLVRQLKTDPGIEITRPSAFKVQSKAQHLSRLLEEWNARLKPKARPHREG